MLVQVVRLIQAQEGGHMLDQEGLVIQGLGAVLTLAQEALLILALVVQLMQVQGEGHMLALVGLVMQVQVVLVTLAQVEVLTLVLVVEDNVRVFVINQLSGVD